VADNPQVTDLCERFRRAHPWHAAGCNMVLLTHRRDRVPTNSVCGISPAHARHARYRQSAPPDCGTNGAGAGIAALSQKCVGHFTMKESFPQIW
jgi:hypothetical protein